MSEEMEAELMQEAMQGVQDFRYGIAKISQPLRQFRNPCEISLCTVFRYDREISLS